MPKTIHEIHSQLKKLSSTRQAKIAQWFFKTGPGEYAEGDQFLGIRVPVLRKVAKEFRSISVEQTTSLLKSSFHEERLLALFILKDLFAKGDESRQRKIYKLYLDHIKYINHWDLVDISAGDIVGRFLLEKDKKTLYRLAKSKSLWERRIAIMATYYLIKCDEYFETLKLAKMLLEDKEDLIHKAVGWMLREIGKRDTKTEEVFLKQHYKNMPRTMLRYAIEKFPKSKRQMYLKGEI